MLWRLDADGVEPEEVAAYGPFDIAIGGDHIYFASGTDSATERLGVARVSVVGGDPDWYFRNGTDGTANAVAIDDEYVYWTVRGAAEGAYRAPHAGFGTISAGDALVGADATRIVEIDGLWGHLALADGYLYWLAHDGIERAPKDGGEIETVRSREQWSCCFMDKPVDLNVRGDYVYWVSGEVKSGGLGRVRSDGTDVQPLSRT